MSVYQKFIDSASKRSGKASGQQSSSSSGAGTSAKSISCNREPQVEASYSYETHRQANSINNTMMIKNPGANTRQHLQLLNSTITSTPINKHQWKRLVESEHQAAASRRRQLEQQQQQQYTSQYQYCSLSCHHHHHHPSHQQQQTLSKGRTAIYPLDAYFKTDDPILLKWLQAMRFETELECLTSLQARTLAIDEHSASALSIRNSQVFMQEMRAESNFILDFIDYLIESLPLHADSNLVKFLDEFSEIWTRLTKQTAANQSQTNPTTTLTSNNQNNLTIINCTPRKSQATVRNLRPLDKLAIQIRNLCVEFANLLYEYQEKTSNICIENNQLEAALRKLKELYGKYVEISMRNECANIVRALHYDFSQTSLNRLSSSSSLHPTRPFESSSSQLPLKWALIALWQLTKDDSYICRTLTEKWQTAETSSLEASSGSCGGASNRVAKRLDYSTKYDHATAKSAPESAGQYENTGSGSLKHSDYQKLYQICQNDERFQQRARENDENRQQQQQQQRNESSAGALSCALKYKQSQQLGGVKQVSTIELLIDIIISQPNKHERLDMMNFIHSQAQNNKLVDLDEWDQSVSAAIYTSNQYKVAALRILNHLCVNEQAVKTILKCFSTPPPCQGHPMPENKIIRSIFECYQTAQEHIYQNETMFHTQHRLFGAAQRGRKRSRQVQQLEDEEYSDYGSRQTNSARTSNSQATVDRDDANTDDGAGDEGDDVVVKEAIRLLVQLTTYFHRSNEALDFYTLIGRFSIDSLVKYMTNIIKSTSNREMLLLSLTALANISFITTEPMKHYGTNRIMLEMFRASKIRSKDLDLRDQAVTILANTADKNLLDIVSNGGLTFLLSCLESCPTRMANYRQLMDRLRRDPSTPSEDGLQRLKLDSKPRDRKPIDFSEDFPDVLGCACDEQNSQSALRHDTSPKSSSFLYQSTTSPCLARLSINELAAMERIHQKTAVAFARMSVDPSTTRLVLKYGGIKQMIDLCKFSYKRNHSDSVLIACIVALRKIAKVIESETFRYYNALDLIELEQQQAYEIYRAPREQQRQQRMFASDV